MTHRFRTLLLGSVLLVAACGSSKGPGEIGSKADIMIRNAGDPEPAAVAAKAPEVKVDPVIAEHDKAVEDAQPVIEEMASQDKDNTPVPGDEPGGMVKAEEAPAEVELTPIEEPAPEPVQEIIMEKVESAPAMEPAKDVMAEPMDTVTMVQPEQAVDAMPTQTAPRPAEPIDEMAAEQVAPVNEQVGEKYAQELKQQQKPVTEGIDPIEPGYQPKPVLEGDPAITSSTLKEIEDEMLIAAPVAHNQTGLIKSQSKELVTDMQKALSEKGYYFGETDGEMGAETLNALHLYQSAHGVSTYGMTYQTLKMLGIEAGSY